MNYVELTSEMVQTKSQMISLVLRPELILYLLVYCGASIN